MTNFKPRCGYSTQDSRLEWLRKNGHPADRSKLTENMLTASPDRSHVLYYWQLYSLLGEDRIYAIVRRFYERVFSDKDDPDFRRAFEAVASV